MRFTVLQLYTTLATFEGKNFSYTHEYALDADSTGEKVIGDRKIPPEDITWSNFPDEIGVENHKRENAKNCFYPIINRGRTRLLGLEMSLVAIMNIHLLKQSRMGKQILCFQSIRI